MSCIWWRRINFSRTVYKVTSQYTGHSVLLQLSEHRDKTSNDAEFESDVYEVEEAAQACYARI